tara:strand:+ start:74 stop:1471 length:1398 start_codon:yes stop_codon:yes gene_type:complete
MDYLLFFLIIIAATFILPEFARRIHIPYVTSIIIAGIAIGPFGFNILDLGDTASFLAFIGAIFLMFTAGLDVTISSLRRIGKKTITIALFNGIIPFATGYYIGTLFNSSFTTSIILGAIFLSSSVAIIIPTLKELKLAETDLGKIIISSTVFEDVLSLLILAFMLKSAASNGIPNGLFVPILVASLLLLFFLLPKLQKMFISKQKETQKEDIFEGELRFIVSVLIVTALLFELLGIHAIIAGFFVGLFLSDAIKHRLVFEKIYTLSYGFFIPIFFLVIGMKTDITQFMSAEAYTLAGVIIGALMLSKFISGFIGSRLAGHSHHESLIVGAATMPQLSTTLVVALLAFESGLFDDMLVSSIVLLSIVTTLISPFLIKFFNRKREEHQKRTKLRSARKVWGMKEDITALREKEKKVKAGEKVIQEKEKEKKKEKREMKKEKKEVKKIEKVIEKKEIEKAELKKTKRK